MELNQLKKDMPGTGRVNAAAQNKLSENLIKACTHEIQNPLSSLSLRGIMAIRKNPFQAAEPLIGMIERTKVLYEKMIEGVGEGAKIDKKTVRNLRKAIVRLAQMEPNPEITGSEGLANIHGAKTKLVELGIPLCNRLISIASGEPGISRTLIPMYYGEPYAVSLEQHLNSASRHQEFDYRNITEGVQIREIAVPIAMAFFIHPNYPLRVVFDPLWVNHAIENILSNARKAISAAERKEVTILVSVRKTDIQLEFRDTGKGMEAHIVEALNLGKKVTTTHEPGEHGLGFQYSRSIIMDLGGEMFIQESTIGVGTTVILRLPIVRTE